MQGDLPVAASELPQGPQTEYWPAAAKSMYDQVVAVLKVGCAVCCRQWLVRTRGEGW